MKSSDSLDEVLANFPEFRGAIDSIDSASNWLYSVLTNWSEENINIISHLADADGFGSQIVFHKGIERVLDFLGNNFKNVQSERIMAFSDNKDSLQSLEFLREYMGEGKYIITDLATLNPSCANELLEDALIVDHHKPKEGFNSRFNVVNPHLDGIDGAKELSASMVSTLILNRVYELVERDYGSEKSFRKSLMKLREDLDYISVFGIAGSKADMQEDSGLNKAMYDFLAQKGILEKIDSPFYGYSKKEAGKVFAQTSPMFNFKYQVPDKGSFNKLVSNMFSKISSQRETLVDKLHGEFKGAFIKEGGSLRVNLPYVSSLSTKDILRLNELAEELIGSGVVEIEHENGRGGVRVCSPFTSSSFESFEDDVRDMSKRVLLAESMIRDLGYDPKRSLFEQKGLSDILENEIRESILYLGDREDIGFSLDKLDGHQYLSKLEKGLVSKSIAEVANDMTALSKLEYGEMYIDAIDEVLNPSMQRNPGSRSSLLAVEEKCREYREYIFRGMESLEKRMLSSDSDLVESGRDAYFLNVGFLEGAFDGNIDLRKMNGVMGGIASNVKLLPSGKGIFFTGVDFVGDYGGSKENLVKISGRATDCSKYEGVKINRFMEHFEGGGHGPAAACVIPRDKLDDFLSSIPKFDFYRGEFDE